MKKERIHDKKENDKIKWLNVIIIILLLPLIIPVGIIMLYPNIAFITSATGILIGISLGIFLFPSTFKHLISNKVVIFITIFFMELAVSSMINHTDDLIDNIKNYCLILLLCFAFYICRRKNAINIFFDSYSIIMSLFIAIGLITSILFPNGIGKLPYTAIDGYVSYTEVYFWGHKNYYPYQIIPYLSIILLNKEYYSRKKICGISYIIWTVIASTEIVLAGSSTGILAVGIFWSIYLIAKYGKKIAYALIDIRIFFGIYIVLFISIVVIGNVGGLISGIAILLGKSSNFTGRTTIWLRALKLIPNHFFLGYGKSTVIPSSGYYWYAHNLILDILIQGGIVALLIFGALLVYCFWHSSKQNIKMNAALWGWLAAFILIFLDESIVKNALFLYLLFLMWKSELNNKICITEGEK